MTRYEIWFINLDPTVVAEIKKTRPCVIISPPQLDYLQTTARKEKQEAFEGIDLNDKEWRW